MVKPLVEGRGLLEGARWYPEHGLLFSDMTLGGVHRLASSDAEPEVLIPHRKGIGGLVAHTGGGLVVAGRNVAHKSGSQIGTETRTVLEKRDDEQFFNDLTADHLGRLYVGAVALDPELGRERGPGRLYRVDLDGSVSTLADDITVSNGLGVSPDDEVLYHVDTHRRTVWAYRDGHRRAFVTTEEYAGVPDGLAVADDGSVWVAMAGGRVVVGWDAAGGRVGEVEVPQDLVTSVMFGDPDGHTLYILTGCNDEYPDPRGGCVYAVRSDRRAQPGARANVPGLPT